jgi:hypothetical protein
MVEGLSGGCQSACEGPSGSGACITLIESEGCDSGSSGLSGSGACHSSIVDQEGSDRNSGSADCSCSGGQQMADCSKEPLPMLWWLQLS